MLEFSHGHDPLLTRVAQANNLNWQSPERARGLCSLHLGRGSSRSLDQPMGFVGLNDLEPLALAMLICCMFIHI
jgi:hypothetical protein